MPKKAKKDWNVSRRTFLSYTFTNSNIANPLTHRNFIKAIKRKKRDTKTLGKGCPLRSHEKNAKIVQIYSTTWSGIKINKFLFKWITLLFYSQFHNSALLLEQGLIQHPFAISLLSRVKLSPLILVSDEFIVLRRNWNLYNADEEISIFLLYIWEF